MSKIDGVTLDRGLKELKELNDLSHSLRGRDSSNNSVKILLRLKELMGSFSDSIHSIQKHYQDGDGAEAARALKDFVGDYESLMVTSKDPQSLLGVVKDVEPINYDVNMHDIPDTSLGDFITPEIYDEIADFSKIFVQSLEDIDLTALAKTPSKKEVKLTTIANDNKSQMNGNENSYPRHFNFDKSITRNIASLPKLNFLSAEQQQRVFRKHELRQEAMRDICLPQCTVDDMKCNCDKLFKCANEMNAYDLAVLNADGYIDKTSGSDSFGELFFLLVLSYLQVTTVLINIFIHIHRSI